MTEYYVYRYTEKKTGEVVYVGKTDHSLSSRIRAHKKEEAFKGYDCFIDFIKLSNAVETDSIEKLLINYYKPVINIKDKVDGLTDIDIPLFNWVPYEYYKDSAKDSSDTLTLQAISDTELILKAIDCSKDGKTDIYMKNLHLSGLLKYRGKHLIVLDEKSIKDDNGYKVFFKKNACDFINSHFYEMLYECWKDVALKENLSVKDKIILCKKIHEIEKYKDNKKNCEVVCRDFVSNLRKMNILKYDL